MSASLREALTSAVEKEEKIEAAAPAAVPAQAESTPAAAPAGDESIAALSDASAEGAGNDGGDASGKPPESAPSADKSTPAVEGATPKPAAADDAAKAAAEAKQHRIDRPPASWKKEAKGEWAAMPLAVRQEVHKRENEINRALAQVAPDRQLAETFKQTVQPFMARIQAMGTDPIKMVQDFFHADHALSTAPKQQRAQFMAQLIKDYDVDINELDTALSQAMGGQGGGQPSPANQPDIAAIVQQQLSQALAPIMQERQQAAVKARQEVEHTVESMALDPKFPYFEEVRMDMADLIDLAARRGVALSLEDAYTRAVRANPDTFSQLERQSTVTSATQQHQAAIRAKAAASSISGAPAGGGGQSNGGDGSLRGAIEAAFGGQRL